MQFQRSVSFTDTHITVGTNNLFLSSATTTAIYRKSDLQQVATNANTGGDGESSLAPYSSDIMIRAQIGESSASTAPSYVFLNTSTGLFSSTQEVPLVGSPRDAIIYKTDSVEFPIFVGQSNDISNTPNVVISAGPGRYAVNISNAGLLYKTDPFVVDTRLLVFTDTNHIYHFNAVSLKVTRVKFDGSDKLSFLGNRRSHAKSHVELIWNHKFGKQCDDQRLQGPR